MVIVILLGKIREGFTEEVTFKKNHSRMYRCFPDRERGKCLSGKKKQ